MIIRQKLRNQQAHRCLRHSAGRHRPPPPAECRTTGKLREEGFCLLYYGEDEFYVHIRFICLGTA